MSVGKSGTFSLTTITRELEAAEEEEARRAEPPAAEEAAAARRAAKAARRAVPPAEEEARRGSLPPQSPDEGPVMTPELWLSPYNTPRINEYKEIESPYEIITGHPDLTELFDIPYIDMKLMEKFFHELSYEDLRYIHLHHQRYLIKLENHKTIFHRNGFVFYEIADEFQSCFDYALNKRGIDAKQLPDGFFKPVSFINSDNTYESFKEFMGKLNFFPQHRPIKNCLVAYIDHCGKISHLAIYENHLYVISKFAQYEAYKHPINNIPSFYGNRCVFFENQM